MHVPRLGHPEAIPVAARRSRQQLRDREDERREPLPVQRQTVTLLLDLGIGAAQPRKALDGLRFGLRDRRGRIDHEPSERSLVGVVG